MNIFIINGRETLGKSEGRLNDTIMAYMAELFDAKHEVKTTVIEKGYSSTAEQEKFLWADLIIFQFPVFWFSTPGIMKSYIDRVYGGGQFFERRHDRPYGSNGLLGAKKYFLSTTWNADLPAFEPDAFFDGRSVDDLLISVHKTQQYTGMQKLESLALYNVMQNANMEYCLSETKRHLEKLQLI